MSHHFLHLRGVTLCKSPPALLILASVVSWTCQQKADDVPDQGLASTAPSPDRIAPEEALIGAEMVMGLRVPEGLRIAARYTQSAQLTGHVPLNVVVETLRKQVLTSHIEITPSRALFARVHVQGDPRRRLLRIEIVRHHNLTRVYISDITPTPVVEGLDTSQRWERAGRNPDGTVKDRLNVF